MEPVAVALGIIVVIVAVMLFGGFYLKITQTPIAPTPTPITPVVTEVPAEIPTPLPETNPPPQVTTTPVPTPTPERSHAGPAIPYNDKKYYNLPYKSTYYNPKGNLPPTIYQQTYVGKFQSEAVVVRALQAPLIVDFILTSAQSPTRSFFFLTLRNNETHELLAQEGFYGPYTENPQKRLFFSSPGEYHINMYGGFVTVDLIIRAPG
ncbi:MAG TPA: hypothetical protein VMT31_08260 [Methanomicrobiales archaeon]|nr:hypothetical protein [Methanomicrobiales archaeon]